MNVKQIIGSTRFSPFAFSGFKRGVIGGFFAFLIVFIGVDAVQASDHGSAHSATSHEEEHSTSGHKSAAHADHGGGDHGGGHGDGHHAPAPGIYYLLWVMLGFGFLITCAYCLKVYKRGKPHHEGLGLAFFLVLLAVSLFALNQLPAVAKHFDPASHAFVDGYHELPLLGFIKFIYKMGFGVLLTIYGLMGMEHH